MTSLIVDASVAVKWHVLQQGSEQARLLGDEGQLYAPEFILAEIANALWKYVRVGQLAVNVAKEMIAKAPYPFTTLFPLQPLQLPALELACALRHPVYDCFYLALAQRLGLPLVTADRCLANAAQNFPGLAVQLLGENR